MPLLLFLFLFISPAIAIAPETFRKDLSEAAINLTRDQVTYNAKYFIIPYPKGDVPKEYGVCTDVVIRAYRKLGVDLQKEVHLDMKENFDVYPKTWGLKHTDTNIDHRRVPNLQMFFTRKGKRLPVTGNSEDYLPGEIVTWDLKENVPHIGLVVNKKSADGKRYLIVHNVCCGQEMEDFLFSHKITGHYFYQPE